MMRKLLLTAFLSSFVTASYAKEIAYVIDGDTGGALLRYEEKAEIIKGAKVVVDGLCLSACAMYLRKDWHLDICYTPSALFGFHKPYMAIEGIIATGITAISTADAAWRVKFFDQMPAGIQAMLSGKQIPSPAAGDPVGRFIYVKARDLHDSVKRCPSDWAAKYKLIDVQNVTTSLSPQ
ncbi:hypothetical protein EN780_03380 [Mesorhizobium sp. M4B.F.Ca.ET.089.01.1.1]|uniref:hypothetical protein n=1 Tax=Mesorhizobium sp. M4B.F.Ca.ET.089.01.1.1 TaxID=2496662 RepID=UPI000FE2F46A|nr:hypothetical protein [Mesorhizobium sp. M4B.F.Ca.ET.089.01.1.1]RWX70450.1 hypothetical protein EN780_03380 [Mesorhizobium sp. M4B.F.Ca.ET.089.01.1.1]